MGLLDTGLGAAFTVPFMRKLIELGYWRKRTSVSSANLPMGIPTPEGICRRLGAPAGPRSIAVHIVRVVENTHRGSKANDQCASECKSAIRVEKLIYGIHTYILRMA
jgi:hypothetical protein